MSHEVFIVGGAAAVFSVAIPKIWLSAHTTEFADDEQFARLEFKKEETKFNFSTFIFFVQNQSKWENRFTISVSDSILTIFFQYITYPSATAISPPPALQNDSGAK